MKLLVTGSAGFIGFSLISKYIKLNEKIDIVGLDNINDYYDPELKYSRLKELGFKKENISESKLLSSETNKKLKFIKLDLSDKEEIKELFRAERFTHVCHLAAQAGVRYSLENPYAYIEANIIGFLNILEAARAFPVKHLCYASSSSVYGLNEKVPFSTKNNVDHPISLYAASKKSNELMAHTYSHLFNIPTTGLRFFTVYGPWGRPDMALFLFTKNILENKEINVFNHGDMQRDFTYVEDIVEGVYRLLKLPPTGNAKWDAKSPDPSSSSAPYKIYNIGNNGPIKLLEFIEAIENKLEKKANKNFMNIQPGDVPKTYADVEDLYNKINFKPETSIKQGVDNFIDWYKGYYK